MSGKRRADGPSVKTKGAQAPRPPRTWKARLLRLVKWGLIATLAGLLLLAVGFFIAYRSIDIPDPNKDFQIQTSYVYYQGGKSEVGRFAGAQNRESIPFSEMPQTVKDAVVAAENQTFYTDSGVDPKGILRAALNNAQGDAVQGGSTITQQYVKILYLTQERSYTRKLREAVLALKLQRQQSKSQILEGYLNTIYFGRGAYGIQAAAKTWFGKDAKDLSLRESAVLASVINNPTQFDPVNGDANREALLGRYRYVLSSMGKLKMIAPQTAQTAEGRLPTFPKVKVQSANGGQRGHILALVKSELLRLGYSEDQIEGGGLKVTTTLTKTGMRAAEQGIKQERPDGLSDKELHVAAASVEPGTGDLKGFYAGQDYLKSQINWALRGASVGSTFKPFAMAAAVKDGFSIKDTFDGNSPYYFPDGSRVVNEGSGLGQDYGAGVSGIYAMQQSINTAFIDMTVSMKDGPRKIVDMAYRMGVPPNQPSARFPGLPNTSGDLTDQTRVTLGTARVSPINMANAYATIANEGVRSQVHVIDKVVSPDGDDYTFKNDATRAMSKDIAADVSYTLQQTVKGGTGRAAQVINRPAAGKTGTATNDDGNVVSSWFVGYTPQLATAVMYARGDGYDPIDFNKDGSRYLPSYFGADFPTRTWAAIMGLDLEGQPVEQFPPPVYVDGKAPSAGHAPVPTRQPSAPASQSPSESPTAPSGTPTPTPTQQPTPTPTPTPTPSPTTECGLVSCPTSPTPTPTPTPTPQRPAGPPGQRAQASTVAYRPVSPATYAYWSVEPWWWV